MIEYLLKTMSGVLIVSTLVTRHNIDHALVFSILLMSTLLLMLSFRDQRKINDRMRQRGRMDDLACSDCPTHGQFD